MGKFEGRTAFVTGGGGGIGREIALRFAAEGCDVAVFDRSAETAEATAADIRARGRRAVALPGDVGTAEAVQQAVGDCLAQLGRIDILVNNAGIARVGPFLQTSREDWQESFRVNVEGAVLCCQKVLPHMIERRSGVVINVSSWLGKAGRPIFSAYSASKFAVIGLTQALALEMAPHGIRVNCICPGIVVGTPMRAEIEEMQTELGLPTTEERRKSIPLGRVGLPDDIARVAVFLASDDSDYMTGEAVNVSGGLWMH